MWLLLHLNPEQHLLPPFFFFQLASVAHLSLYILVPLNILTAHTSHNHRFISNFCTSLVCSGLGQDVVFTYLMNRLTFILVQAFNQLILKFEGL